MLVGNLYLRSGITWPTGILHQGDQTSRSQWQILASAAQLDPILAHGRCDEADNCTHCREFDKVRMSK
jgi:hypothetical protein